MSVNNFFGDYQSQTTRQLATINSSRYPDTNKDFEANIRRLNGFVDYIAQYLQTMQKGIDQANADVFKQIKNMAGDLVVLLGGGELLYGIDLGDLQYFLPALGALFGLDSDTPFPINLFEMAQRFFLGYVVPLDAFGYAIQDIINGWAVALGLDPEFVEALNDVMDELIELGTSLMDILNDLFDLLDILGISTDGFGPFADIWHVVTQLLGSFSLEQIGDIADPVLHALAPWVKQLAHILAIVGDFVQAVGGNLENGDLGPIFGPVFDVASTVFESISGPAIDALAVVFDLISQWQEPFVVAIETVVNAIEPVLEPLLGLLEGGLDAVDTIVDLIGIGQITDLVRNLLPNANFLQANSITQGGGIWNWVNDIVHGVGGSATAAANGTLRELLSDPWTEVRPGETLNVSNWLRWTGVTATAGQPAFSLGLTIYNALGQIIATPTLNSVTNPAAASNNPSEGGFIKLVGNYTVPANAAYARQRFTITQNALTGATWWGDASFGKTQKLKADWLDQWQNLLDTIAGSLPGLGTILGLGTRLFALNPNGTVDASQLSNMANIPNLPGLSKIPDLQTLVDYATNSLSGQDIVGDVLTGVGLDTAKDTMTQLYGVISGLVRKVQNLETDQQSASNGGKKFTINFSSYPNGAFPSGLFNMQYSGPGTSVLGINNGNAVWNLVNNGDRSVLMQYPEATATDFQQVRGTMASPPEQGSGGGQRPQIWAIARMNAAGTSYVWARGYCTGFLSYKGDIGCTVNGVETVWLSGVSLTWSLDMRLIAGVGNNARRYMVLSGDTIVVDMIEPGTASQLGPNNRYWGARSDVNGRQTPGAVAGAAVVDNAPPAVVGSTARVSRRNGGDVTINSGGQKVPNNFYETVDYISDDLVYQPGSNCQFLISKQGTYLMQWRIYHGQFATGTAGAGLAYKNGTRHSLGPMDECPFNVGYGVMSTPTNATFGSIIVAANPGDTIGPGFQFTNNMSNTGDNSILADGSQSWCSITRVGI